VRAHSGFLAFFSYLIYRKTALGASLSHQ
jgi:hypothetical protein